MSKDYENDTTLALWFTPRAIKDAFDAEDDERAEWVRNATDEQLVQIGQACLGSDLLYSTFHEVLDLMVEEMMQAFLVIHRERYPSPESSAPYGQIISKVEVEGISEARDEAYSIVHDLKEEDELLGQYESDALMLYPNRRIDLGDGTEITVVYK